MKKIVFLLIIISITAMFFLLPTKWQNNIRNIHNIPEILFSIEAKELCSCYFVVKQTRKHCVTIWEKNGYPSMNLKIDEENRTVTAGIIMTEKAIYISQKEGCRLL